MLRLAAALASLIACASPALADIPPPPQPENAVEQASTDPVALVSTLYTGYFAALNQTVDKPDLQMPAEWEYDVIADKFFTPELAARMHKALKSEDAVIDWDIFADGQDFKDVKLVKATSASVLGDKATVAVTTSNMGTESHTNVMLVRTTAGWRIADMDFWPGTKNETTLTAVLKEYHY